jgi:hypothetical protein
VTKRIVASPQLALSLIRNFGNISLSYAGARTSLSIIVATAPDRGAVHYGKNKLVMPGLVPGIHVGTQETYLKQVYMRQ